MQNCGVVRLCYRLPGTSPGRIHVRMNREPLCKRVALSSQLLRFLLCEESLHEQVAMFLIKCDLFLRKHAGPPPLRSLPFTVLLSIVARFTLPLSSCKHWRCWEYIFTPNCTFYGKLYHPFLGPFLFYFELPSELEKVFFCRNVLLTIK